MRTTTMTFEVTATADDSESRIKEAVRDFVEGLNNRARGVHLAYTETGKNVRVRFKEVAE